eukprot:193588-Rhodomonas_salina.2
MLSPPRLQRSRADSANVCDTFERAVFNPRHREVCLRLCRARRLGIHVWLRWKHDTHVLCEDLSDPDADPLVQRCSRNCTVVFTSVGQQSRGSIQALRVSRWLRASTFGTTGFGRKDAEAERAEGVSGEGVCEEEDGDVSERKRALRVRGWGRSRIGLGSTCHDHRSAKRFPGSAKHTMSAHVSEFSNDRD